MSKFSILILTFFSFYFGFGQNNEIDSLLVVVSTSSKKIDRASAFQRLAWLHILKNTEIATNYNDSSAAIYRILKDERGIAQTNYKFAVINRFTGNYKNALSYIDDYLAYIITQKDSQRLADALYQKAAIYTLKGDLDSSLAFYYKTLQIYNDINDTLSAANIHNSLGIINRDMRDYDKAILNFEKSIDILKHSERQNDLANSYINLAGIYLLEKRFELAEEYLDKSLNLYTELKNSYGIGQSLKDLGLLAYKNGNLERSISHLEKSAKIFKENQYSKELLENLVIMGEVYQVLSDFKKSEEVYDKALKYRGTSKPALQELYFGLHNLYRKTTRHEEALNVYKHYISYKDSIFQEDRVKNAKELEIQYETAIKEAQLFEQQLQIQNQENELLKKRTQYAYVLTSGIVLLFVALGLWLYYRQRQKLKNIEIAQLQQESEINTLEGILQGEENERFRIAKDLHDGINGDLAAIKYKIASVEHGELKADDKTQYREAMKMLDNAVEQVRLISHNLTPPSLQQFSLSEALKQFCTKVNISKTLKVDYQFFGEELKLDKNTETTIYRLVQELVNNVLKHANASEAIVQLNNHGTYLQITIEDNGIGFDVSKNKEGIGLKNAKSRVQLLNAQMDIKSDQSGSTFTIDIGLTQFSKT